MDEELKRKLFDLEVNPPERIWGRINAALNDEMSLEFSDHLQTLEIEPSARVWNSIEAALDKDIVLKYPSRLYNLKIEPPVDSWYNLAAALDEIKILPRISPVKRKIPIVKYAVAASVLALIAFGVKWLTAERTNTGVAIQNTPTQKTEQQQNKQEEIKLPDANTSATNNLPKERPRDLAKNLTTKKSYARSAAYMTSLGEVSQVKNQETENFRNTSLQGDIPGSQTMLGDELNRYLLFTNPEGYIIRISKKLAEALGCLYADGNSVEYKRCQEQLKRWRDKIAQSNVSPSSDNFLDILELIKSIDDKQF